VFHRDILTVTGPVPLHIGVAAGAAGAAAGTAVIEGISGLVFSLILFSALFGSI
jgi:hypothetical protein